MSLREELARKLFDLYWSQRGYKFRELGAMSPEDPIVWASMADECIRQMEWARRKCSQLNVVEYFGPRRLDDGTWSDARGVHVEGFVPLSLAPEEWKP